MWYLRREGVLTIANTTVADEPKSRLHIVHGDGFTYPSPVPNDLYSNRTTVEREALRRKLLTAFFETGEQGWHLRFIATRLWSRVVSYKPVFCYLISST